MSKMQAGLKKAGTKNTARGPITTTGATERTGNGAVAFARDAKSDLFLLAVSNFVSEDTFYEDGKTRDARFSGLVHAVTMQDPEWMQKFIPWLRNEANMRSASLVAAAEYVKAGGPSGRSVVSSSMARADEPAEFLAYWLANYGRALPAAVKRGVADAAVRFFNERNVIKYDTAGKAVSFADVIQLTHPKAGADWQNTLFKYVLAKRYDDEFGVRTLGAMLPMINANRNMRTIEPAEARRILLSGDGALENAGMTWEALSSFGAMDKAAWEAVIPSMGYMALLRNLRNFDEQGVSDSVAKKVADKLADPDEVARSRQLPFRFWSAYSNTPSLRWAWALEQALDHSTKNVPEFDGPSLILVDTSASMTGMGYSARSKITPANAAALFGAILARKNAADVRMVGFADGTFEHQVKVGQSALSIMQSFTKRTGEVGHGTDIAGAMRSYNGERRVFLFSDMQTSSYFSRDDSGHIASGYSYGWSSRRAQSGAVIPTSVPIYGFNLQGYGAASLASGKDVREYEFGGLTDKTFSMIRLIEQAKSSGFPWE